MRVLIRTGATIVGWVPNAQARHVVLDRGGAARPVTAPVGSYGFSVARAPKPAGAPSRLEASARDATGAVVATLRWAPKRRRATLSGMDADLAAVAALIADPSRAAMLDALNGGEAKTAGALARIAGVAPSTATEHLDRLERGGLVVSERRGRARHVRLAGPRVARALEGLAAIAPLKRPTGLKAWHHGEALRAARSCYDHLAGVAGVALADALVERGALEPGEGAFAITRAGERAFDRFGLDVAAIRDARRATARACLDWSERRPHVAGALGAALLEELLRRRWLQRRTDGRALTLTPAGADGLAAEFGLALATIRTNSAS